MRFECSQSEAHLDKAMKTSNSNEYLERPGITFSVSIDDPKQRVQAYLDSYKDEIGESEVRSPPLPPCYWHVRLRHLTTASRGLTLF